MLSRLRAALRTPLLAALVVSSAAACGGDGSAGPGPATSRAATAEIFMGDDQSGGAGDTLFLPLVVEVRDGQGNRLSGERVTFTVASGDGSVSPAEVLTRVDGTAMATFVLGRTLGAQSVVATVGGLPSLTFTATAVTPDVTELVVVSGAGQSGQVATALPAPLVLRTVDRLGYPVAGTYVSLAVPAGAGTLSPASGQTDANGEFRATWTLGTAAGAASLTASAWGPPSVTVSATAVPGPASQLAVISGDDQFGTVGTALPVPVVVGITDAHGNPVAAGTSVTLTAATGGGSVSQPSTTTDANGRVSGTWTLGARVGTNTLTAATGGLPSATLTAVGSVPIWSLDHRVVDAEMSPTTGKIVTVSANPSRLNVIDPETRTVQTVALTYAPLSVSVRPDGAYAAVGHDGYLSYVNLTTLAVVGTHAVGSIAADVVLASNGYAYVFPSGSWVNIRSVNLSTGAVTQSSVVINGGTKAKLHPSGQYIYGADNGSSPSDGEKYDIRGGTAQLMYDSPYHGDHEFSGNLWLFEGGTPIIMRSGNLFHASTVTTQDLTYAGSLADALGIVSASHSASASRILVLDEGMYQPVPALAIRAYNASGLAHVGDVPLPKFNVEGTGGTTQYAAHGRFVSFNAAGTRAYALVRADPQSGLALDWGLAAFDRQDIP